MKWQGLTWPQVALVAVAMAGIIAAYKFGGVNAAAIVSVITHLVLGGSGGKD